MGCSLIFKFIVVIDIECDLDGDGIGIWKIEFVMGEFEGNFVFVDDLIYLKN